MSGCLEHGEICGGYLHLGARVNLPWCLWIANQIKRDCKYHRIIYSTFVGIRWKTSSMDSENLITWTCMHSTLIWILYMQQEGLKGWHTWGQNEDLKLTGAINMDVHHLVWPCDKLVICPSPLASYMTYFKAQSYNTFLCHRFKKPPLTKQLETVWLPLITFFLT